MLKSVETYRETNEHYEALLEEIERLRTDYERTASSDPATAAEYYRELAAKHAESEKLYAKLTGIRLGLSDTRAALS